MLKSLTPKLKDPSLLETRAYIDGAFVETDSPFPVFNPSDGERIADVADVRQTGTQQTRDGLRDIF